jgi:Asp-tRNA(Asn)/Glu-tRNA(Gln) amidotransferase A subunit family amidase
MLREAGAVLVAKLTTGELAQGDQWFGGRTKNPWNLTQGSSGSSAGPASATAAGCVAFGIGSETSGSILSPSQVCGITGLRPTFGRVSRYGVMALSWTQDRLGPLCRYSEDCALVMNVIARPDDRDMSVSEIPFNWNAQMDIRKLRVGYLKEGFDEAREGPAKDHDQKTLEQVRALGVKLVEVSVPEVSVDTSSFNVESGAFFDELIRSGRDKEMSNPGRAAGWRTVRLMPAVEYIQSQRMRTMMMMKLAEATKEVDVYLVPTGAGGGGAAAGGRRGAVAAAGTAAAIADGTAPAAAAPVAPAGGRGAAGAAGRRANVTGRHFNMANVAGYPALAVPNGFGESGSPGSITFYGRPFCETEILALGKAYQDAAGFHLKHPTLG